METKIDFRCRGGKFENDSCIFTVRNTLENVVEIQNIIHDVQIAAGIDLAEGTF